MSQERIISPGVFTKENDLSYVPAGIAQIGAVVIGRTEKGRAFEPVEVSGMSDFVREFGQLNPDYPTTYLAKEYLAEAGKLTVVRPLAGGSFTFSNVGEISSGSTLLAVIRPTSDASGTFDVIVTGSNVGGYVSASSFDLAVSESSGITTYTSVSLRSTDSNYIGKILGSDPKSTATKAYVAHIFKQNVSQSIADYNGLIATGSVVSSTSAQITSTGYTTANSPWIISQTFGATNHSLFRFHHLGAGTYTNTDVKIGIFNIKPSGSVAGSDYGSFGLVVREYSDTDKNPNILETYNDLTLDVNSPNYIARRIGDQYYTTDSDGKRTSHGNYPNLSKYIRVEMASLDGVPNEAVPFGFKQYKKYNSNTSDVSYQLSQSIDGVYNKKAYFGIDFTHQDIGNYHQPLPSNAANVGTNFLLSSCVSQSNDLFGGSLDVDTSPQSELQFIFGLQTGFDGYDPRVAVVSQSTFTSATSSGSVEYNKAIKVVQDPEDVDFNLLLTPEMNYREHSPVCSTAIDVCETRGDALYIMDCGQKADSISTVINTVKTLDSNYVATYWPWVKIKDDVNNKFVWVAPSVVAARAIAKTDKLAYEWYAPAGINRGGIENAVQTYRVLNSSDRNDLYAGRINPIASFRDTGISIWGQKTLQVAASSLDRVNVRRLLIKIKKLFASTAKYMVFEQNNAALWTKFKSRVEPTMDSIVANAGLDRYEIIMDESTNTPDVIDRNEVAGKIQLWPTKSGEFFVLDFNILSTGALFS